MWIKFVNLSCRQRMFEYVSTRTFITWCFWNNKSLKLYNVNKIVNSQSINDTTQWYDMSTQWDVKYWNVNGTQSKLVSSLVYTDIDTYMPSKLLFTDCISDTDTFKVTKARTPL